MEIYDIHCIISLNLQREISLSKFCVSKYKKMVWFYWISKRISIVNVIELLLNLLNLFSKEKKFKIISSIAINNQSIITKASL